MTVQGRTIMEDPPISPGSSLPFHIQEVPLDSPLSQIEIGKSVPKVIKEKLHAVHNHHKAVFDGDISEGYNGASGFFDVDFDFINDVPPSVHKGAVPDYHTKKDLEVLQAKIEELEQDNIVAKVSSLGMNLKFASPCMLAKKSSAKLMPVSEYEKLPLAEKVKMNRFVLCCNKLCNSICKKPATVTNIEETINIVSSFEYVITADLQDSFNQRWITEEKLPYFGFHSPLGDNYVLLRSPQGLINQSEELEMLVKVTLQEGVRPGHT